MLVSFLFFCFLFVCSFCFLCHRSSHHQFAQKYSEIIDSKLYKNIIRLIVAAPLFNCAAPLVSTLPTHFMRSNGIDCTKYSRCSFVIKHIGRFFCVISSSRSFSDFNNSGNQVSSHEHINGLSEKKTIKKNHEKRDKRRNVRNEKQKFFSV